MNPHFTIFGLTLYWYGLIVGIAMAIGLLLVDLRAARYDRQQQLARLAKAKGNSAKKGLTTNLQLFFQKWSPVILIGGLVGARLWHLVTDWWLYQGRWGTALNLTQGGLSILGGLAGGLLAVMAARRLHRVPLPLITDTLVFGVPLAQAFGRLGNWVNQELYGPPTDLPWAVTIEPARRLAGYEQFVTYHPLFLYEALAMVATGSLIWWLDRRQPGLFGSGVLTLLYLTLYSGVRFGLDFLRLDRPVWQLGLGLNQVLLLAVFIVCSLALVKRKIRRGSSA